MSGTTTKLPAFGLTGGIASGKSTVARYLESLGAKVMNADQMGHELLIPGSPAYPQIISSFGREILIPTGESAAEPGREVVREIDRKRLAAIVFANPQKLRVLNAILHPMILQRILEITRQTWEGEPGIVIVVEATLIYETGIEKNFLKIIATWCRPEQQLERLLAKGEISREDADARIAAQIPLEQKCSRADYVIDCSASIDATQTQVKSLYPELRQVAAGSRAES